MSQSREIPNCLLMMVNMFRFQDKFSVQAAPPVPMVTGAAAACGAVSSEGSQGGAAGAIGKVGPSKGCRL